MYIFRGELDHLIQLVFMRHGFLNFRHMGCSKALCAGASAAAVVAEHVARSILKDYYHTMGIDRFSHIDIN